ncbi:hypothetical protein RB195_015872 [Necator americanus]|uniref:Uncharacterized protein n=1 Tax=Necator americanus TaxID=51031 RepID=A0ABR1E6V2_NECAM
MTKQPSIDDQFHVVYSDFDLNLHRQIRDCTLSILKNEGGLLNEQVIKTISTKMEEGSLTFKFFQITTIIN